MAYIEEFLGKRVTIPEDRYYYPKQGLWAKPKDTAVIFGLTEPALVLAGGISGIDWLATEGQTMHRGEAVVFAITGKIAYIDTPIGGAIYFNDVVKANPELIQDDPYENGWMFKITPRIPLEDVVRSFIDYLGYIESLKGSEGFKNPKGIKGGVSGICKAVYSDIREQKIENKG
jgi:glycine cleavage system H protein